MENLSVGYYYSFVHTPSKERTKQASLYPNPRFRELSLLGTHFLLKANYAKSCENDEKYKDLDQTLKNSKIKYQTFIYYNPLLIFSTAANIA